MTITHGGPPSRQAALPRPRTAEHDTIDRDTRARHGTDTRQFPPAPRTAPARRAAPVGATPVGATPVSVTPSTVTPISATPVGGAVPRVRLGAQIALIAAAVAAYFLVRGATEAAYGDALRHALALVDIERALGIYWEPALQDSLASSPRVRTVLNAIYIYGHWPVIVASLLWLARSNPAIYLRARNAMLISGGIGLVVFISYPVAPPRLAELGMTDTVSVASGAYRVLQPTMFTNQYAALPSLHVGWDLLIGLALAAALRRPLLRALAMLMPVAMVVAVVLTANHYIVDAAAGAALTTACWLLTGTRARRMLQGLPRRLPRQVRRAKLPR